MNVGRLVDHLNATCHGAGFDQDWSGEDLPDGRIVLSGGFHAMDEHGFYDGWACFTVALDPAAPRDFTLTFSDEDSADVAEEHQLRDYIEESVAYALDEFTG